MYDSIVRDTINHKALSNQDLLYYRVTKLTMNVFLKYLQLSDVFVFISLLIETTTTFYLHFNISYFIRGFIIPDIQEEEITSCANNCLFSCLFLYVLGQFFIVKCSTCQPSLARFVITENIIQLYLNLTLG